MAIGVYITFKILDIPDMTVDGTFALGGCLVAATVSAGWNPVASTLLSILCGMAAGLVTGILHTKLKICLLYTSRSSLTEAAVLRNLKTSTTLTNNQNINRNFIPVFL